MVIVVGAVDGRCVSELDTVLISRGCGWILRIERSIDEYNNYCSFFSAIDSRSSSARRASLLSRPLVIMDRGSRSANNDLHTTSMIQHPAKSTTIVVVRRTAN